MIAPGRATATGPDQQRDEMSAFAQRFGLLDHPPGGTAAGGGIDPELGAARPGVVQPALPYLVVDHNLVDRLGHDGPFLLQARGDAQGLLGVIEPKVALGHAVVP
jgi:hypothetical protein